MVTENQRVLDATQALQSRDPDRFGSLMYRSHESLRDDFEVSCSELNLLVTMASTLPGVYGARMMGGGFGGCTVSLIRSDCVETFQSAIATMYAERTGITPEIYICEPAQGAESWPKGSVQT